MPSFEAFPGEDINRSGGPADPCVMSGLAPAARAFGASSQPMPGAACDVWTGGEAEAVLQRWFEAWRRAGAPGD